MLPLRTGVNVPSQRNKKKILREKIYFLLASGKALVEKNIRYLSVIRIPDLYLNDTDPEH